MATSGSTTTITFNLKKDRPNKTGIIVWGFCPTNPITQVLEHYYKQRKNNG